MAVIVISTVIVEMKEEALDPSISNLLLMSDF